MTFRPDRILIIGLILLTTLPFLLLFRDLSEVYPITDIDIFWPKFIFITANITGFIGAALLVWSFLLGFRSLVSLITPDLVWVLGIHKWIGKYGVLLIILHPILEMISYLEGVAWLFVPDLSSQTETHISYGRLAFLLLLIIYITSALIRDRLKFRPWLYVHYLSYPLMFFTFLHANEIGTYLNKYPALKALWFTLFTLFGILVVYRLVEWGGWLSPKYRVVGKYKQTENINVLVLEPLGRWLLPDPGQFVYLQLKSFGETHPFSVMEYDSQTGKIILGIKTFGAFTQKIDILEVGNKVNLTGPFGVFTKEAHNDKPKVLIAGGIGITPFVDVVKKYKTDDTILLYATRSRSQLILHQLFQQALGDNYKVFLSDEANIQEPNVTSGLITADSLISAVGGQSHLNSYQYFLCGPPPFMKGVKQSLITLGVPDPQIFTEEFSY